MVKKQRFVLNVIVLLFWFAQYVYIPYQTTYLVSQNLSMDIVGLILGIYGGMQMCCRMPIGIYSDTRKQHSLLIILGMTFAGLGSLLRICLPTRIGFFLGNILAGFGSSMWSAFMAMFLGLYPDNEKQEATGLIMFLNNAGKLTAFICATICYPILGMKFLCSLGVTAGAVGALSGIWLRKSSSKRTCGKATEFSFHFLSKRLLLFAVLTLMQQGVQMSTAMAYTSDVLKQAGASQVQIGLSSIIYMTASVFFSRIVSMEGVKKKGPRFWIPFSFLTIGLYCWGVPNAPNIYVIWLLQIAAGLQTGLLFTYLTAEAVNGIKAEQRATALAFFQMMYAVGMTVFPMISGAISEQYGLKTAFYLLGIVGIMGAGIAGIYYGKERSNLTIRYQGAGNATNETSEGFQVKVFK